MVIGKKGEDIENLKAELTKRLGVPVAVNIEDCLLYTSDAADERSSVDLGGRRIIKKKNIEMIRTSQRHRKQNTQT